jgi:hypothetical protein
MEALTGVAIQSFTFFKQTIEPYLRCIKANQQARLLAGLYSLAKSKVNLEFFQNTPAEWTSATRAAANQFERVRVHLTHARDEVQKAKEILDEDLLKVHSEDCSWDELLETLNLGVQSATNLRKMYTAGIHPDLRTDAEKSLILPDDEIQPYTYPGKGVTASDYWFIGRAEQLLKKCRTEKGEKLQPVNYHRIISKTFAAAFNQRNYSEERIKTALSRIRQRPRLKYRVPFPDTPATRHLDSTGTKKTPL